MRVLGVDAYTKGWVAIELVGGRFAAAHLLTHLTDLWGLGDYDAIAVDIPMGLLNNDFRRAEAVAKTMLGKLAPAVFSTPPRPVLLENTHEAANALCRRMTGKGLSAQSYASRQRIFEADELYGDPRLPIYEVHPEISFREDGGTTARGE